jgi:hypothetical protein
MGVVFAVVVNAAIARAQIKSHVELEWNVPAGCLDSEAARAAIGNALGARALERSVPVVVRVTITQLDIQRWNADLWMYDAAGSGERSVVGTTCDGVAQASLLIVTLALIAGAESQAPPKQPAPASNVPGDLQARLRFAGGARVLGDVGSLPAAGPPHLGFALVLAVQYRQLSAEADASFWLPRVSQQGLAAGSGGRLFLYTGALRGCLDLLQAAGGPFNVGPCAGAELGAMVGRGFGLAERRTRSVFWGAGLLGISGRYLGAAPLWIGLLIEVGLPLHRAAWQVDDVGTVFQVSPLVGRASLGVGWQFP